MKLATFHKGSARLGALVPDTDFLLDLQLACCQKTGHADPALLSMQALIDAGERGLALASDLLSTPRDQALLALQEVRFLAPLEPRALRCCSVFDGHHRAVVRALQQLGERAPLSYDVPSLLQAVPAYYKANHLNVRGPDDVILWPAFGDDLDFELELAVVIGRPGKDVAVASASAHIFGFTIYNDVSARKPQLLEMTMGLGPAKSKDFDGANILGPLIVTADEFDGDDALAIARIDGIEIGRARSSEMRQRWAEIISYRSLGETIHPGEVITSGAFTGCSGIEHLRFLEPGELLELEIEGIGVLRNMVGPRPRVPVEWPGRGSRQEDVR